MLREGERATKMVKIGMWWCINIIWLKKKDCWTPFLHKLNTHFMTHSENGLIVFIFSLFCHFMTFNDIKKRDTKRIGNVRNKWHTHIRFSHDDDDEQKILFSGIGLGKVHCDPFRWFIYSFWPSFISYSYSYMENMRKPKQMHQQQ